ncbi:MAG: glycosyltransferase family 2 protein [Candidatus Obscuribacterales bacterium]|nr:glycosyltransferase family 2 protein [Candidatus Obscuribacterales bacterium]
MLISVITVSWNTREFLRASLQSLLQELSDPFFANSFEVFLVDNDSADGSSEMVAENFPQVKLIANDTNRGFAAANNQAMNIATGEFVVLLNPDTVVHPGGLKHLIEFMNTHPEAGIVAPQLLNSDGTIQRSCRQFPTFLGMLYELLGLSRIFPDKEIFRQYKMLDWEHDDIRQVDQPEGACLLVRRKVIDEVGTLDEGFFMLFEEVDWCYRIKEKGWQIWFTTAAQVTHHYGQSIKQVKARMILSSHRGLYRFWRKHYRAGRWYLDAFAYGGLMSLAYVRIVSHKLKQVLKPS